MDNLSFPKLPNAAIAVGATAPLPSGGAGSYVWSTTLSEPLWFDGAAWVRPPGNAGASSVINSISVPNVQSLPTLLSSDRTVAINAITRVRYFWNGAGWKLEGTERTVNPLLSGIFLWDLRGYTTSGSVTIAQSDVFEVDCNLPAARVGDPVFPVERVTPSGDADEAEFDQLVCIDGFATCVSDDTIRIRLLATPGPFIGDFTAKINFRI